MKKVFWTISFVLIAFCAKAQNDSITIVIQCDSLYLPFMEHAGKVRLSLNKKERTGLKDICFSIGKVRSFKIPKPPKNKVFELKIGAVDWPLYYLSSYYGDITLNGYLISNYDSYSGKFLYSDTISFPKDTLLLKFPKDLKYAKFLIDNSCPKCSKNDSVSWIYWGLFVQDENGELHFENPFNPYDNPILDEIYGGGCEPGLTHWYCHRCKREY